MCKYVIVIAVIAGQDVDGHFCTTLNLPAGLLSTYCVCQYTHKPINQLLPIIGRQLTSDKNFVGVQHYFPEGCKLLGMYFGCYGSVQPHSVTYLELLRNTTIIMCLLLACMLCPLLLSSTSVRGFHLVMRFLYKLGVRRNFTTL